MKNLIAISGKIGSGKDTVGAIIRHLIAVDLGIAYNSKDENFPTEVWKKTGILPVQTTHVTGWEIKKFASKLKQIIALLTGCKVEQLENQDFKNSYLDEAWDSTWHQHYTPKGMVAAKMTYREMLQKIGTDALRNQLHENVWVNALFADYKTDYVAGIDPIENNIKPEDVVITKIYPNWIITDMRFPNELKAVEDRNGITIRVNRPKEKVILEDKIAEKVINTTKNFGIIEHPSETALDNAKFNYKIDNDGTIEELTEKIKEILIKEQIIKS